MNKLIGFLCVSILGAAFYSNGQTTNNLPAPTETLPFHFERLRADELNFVGYAIPTTDGALDDENHLQIDLSIKYPLFNKPDAWPMFPRLIDWLDTSGWIPHRAVFFYNGQYDFYINSKRYESSPIISRRQNPGLAVEWDTHEHLNWRLGYFHESNGQSLSRSNDYVAVENEFGEEYALSQVSRGWDYANLRLLYDSNPRNLQEQRSWWRTSVELRHYFDSQGLGSFDREDHIFWAPVSHQPGIQEYDGLRTMAEYTFDRGNDRFLNGIMARIELKNGIGSSQDLGNMSAKYTLNFKLWNTWLSTFYFNGYGKEPSTYHRRTEYFGIGIELR